MAPVGEYRLGDTVFSFSGRAVFVTGGTQGIGLAIAEAFARAGADVAICARTQSDIAKTCDVLEPLGSGAVHGIVADLADPEAPSAVFSEVVGHFSRVDVLVNNAGYGLYGLLEDTSEQDFRDLLETNVLGPQRAIRAALPHMRRQRAGHIVNVGSVVGKRGWPYHGAYAASKFALTGLTQSLRGELAGSGVSVSLVLPATTASEFFASASIVTPGYEPQALGPVHTPIQVARVIMRTVEHPSAEVNVVPVMRVAQMIAEALPALAARVSEVYFRRFS